MKFTGLGHVALMLQELQPAIDFYCGKLGFAMVTDNREANGENISYFLRKDGIALELIVSRDNPAPRGGVIDHISFLVENVEQARRELLDKGVVFETDDVLFDPYLYERGEKFILFRGPNGERLQLEQIL